MNNPKIDEIIAQDRTDARDFSKNTTIKVLQKIYGDTKKMTILDKPFLKRTQTSLHGDDSKKPGECDIILISKS
jgi:hypothetical protein